MIQVVCESCGPALRASGLDINTATRKKHTPEQVVRKLATADRAPRDKYTTWTAVAPDLVFTVLTYGPSPLCGPPLVRNSSSPDQQTSRSPRRVIGYTRILSQVGIEENDNFPAPQDQHSNHLNDRKAADRRQPR